MFSVFQYSLDYICKPLPSITVSYNQDTIQNYISTLTAKTNFLDFISLVFTHGLTVTSQYQQMINKLITVTQNLSEHFQDYPVDRPESILKVQRDFKHSADCFYKSMIPILEESSTMPIKEPVDSDISTSSGSRSSSYLSSPKQTVTPIPSSQGASYLSKSKSTIRVGTPINTPQSSFLGKSRSLITIHPPLSNPAPH